MKLNGKYSMEPGIELPLIAGVLPFSYTDDSLKYNARVPYSISGSVEYLSSYFIIEINLLMLTQILRNFIRLSAR